MRFDACVEVIFEKEGGFVNHPSDPGGATNYGITKRVYEEFLGRRVTDREVEEMPKLHAKVIYERLYWNRLKCYWLPVGVDLVLFDMGVNAGVSRAGKILQQEVGGLVVDGIIGSKTTTRVNEFTRDNGPEELVELYTEARICYYRSLDNFEVFGRGWTNRCRDVRERAMEMIKNYG